MCELSLFHIRRLLLVEARDLMSLHDVVCKRWSEDHGYCLECYECEYFFVHAKYLDFLKELADRKNWYVTQASK